MTLQPVLADQAGEVGRAAGRNGQPVDLGKVERDVEIADLVGREVQIMGERVGNHLWLRVEHQTFIVAPGASQAVFTIRVMLEPLGTLIQTEEQAQQLHAAISTMSGAVVAYRSFGHIKPVVLAWLAQRMPS